MAKSSDADACSFRGWRKAAVRICADANRLLVGADLTGDGTARIDRAVHASQIHEGAGDVRRLVNSRAIGIDAKQERRA
jgi:alkylation response protein AidB-like acyl-CoA dehydrogenase